MSAKLILITDAPNGMQMQRYGDGDISYLKEINSYIERGVGFFLINGERLISMPGKAQQRSTGELTETDAIVFGRVLSKYFKQLHTDTWMNGNGKKVSTAQAWEEFKSMRDSGYGESYIDTSTFKRAPVECEPENQKVIKFIRWLMSTFTWLSKDVWGGSNADTYSTLELWQMYRNDEPMGLEEFMHANYTEQSAGSILWIRNSGGSKCSMTDIWKEYNAYKSKFEYERKEETRTKESKGGSEAENPYQQKPHLRTRSNGSDGNFRDWIAGGV
jgi:hypothetical protein